MSGALAHAAFAPLRDAASRAALRREVPVALAEPTGAIVEGVVDAAFETDAGWVVVDFKTDADPGEALDAYLGQVRLYARAIATGAPALNGGRPLAAVPWAALMRASRLSAVRIAFCGSRARVQPVARAVRRPAGIDWTVHPLRGRLA